MRNFNCVFYFGYFFQQKRFLRLLNSLGPVVQAQLKVELRLVLINPHSDI